MKVNGVDSRETVVLCRLGSDNECLVLSTELIRKGKLVTLKIQKLMF